MFMEGRKSYAEKSITKEYRGMIQTEKIEKRGQKLSINSSQDNRDLLTKAITDISQESLIQGLIYSEIFGLPKCKRRGR